MLQFIEGGNWLPSEAGASNAPYRARMRSWARSYSQACLNYSLTGRITSDERALTHHLDTTGAVCVPGVQPKPEQVQPALLGINFGRMALFGNIGFGKTFTLGYTIAYLQRLTALREVMNNRFVVFAPMKVVREWHEQCTKFFGLRVATYPGTQLEWADIIVTNYEQASNFYMDARHLVSGVVLDESHRVKNIYTQTFGHIASLMDGLFFRFVLTGTPLTKDPNDLFTQLSLINPYAFDFSHGYMMDRYFYEVKMGAYSKRKFRQQDAHIFHAATRRNALRCDNPEENKPDTDVQVFPVEPTPEQLAMLEKVASGNVSVVKAQKRLGGTAEFKALQGAIVKEAQVSSGYVSSDDQPLRFGSSKLAAVMKHLKGPWAGQQAILWVQFRETAERLRKALGDNSTIVYGGMSHARANEALDGFRDGRYQYLICQLKTGNAGLNLQFCNHAAFVELDWSHTTIDQAIGRIARSGQTKRCHIAFFYTTSTADELMLDAYRHKRKVTAAVLEAYAAKGAIGAKDVVRKRAERRSTTRTDRLIAETKWGMVAHT